MSSNSANVQYQEAHAGDTAVARLIAVLIVCFVISYAAIILRILSRRLSRTRLGTDDWLILLSLLFTTAFLSGNTYLTHIGLGKHAILMKKPKSFVLGYAVLEVLYTITIFIVKLSTLCLWHRLFPGRGFTTSLYIIGGICIAYSITQMVCVVTQCIPLSTLWNPSIKGTCIDLGRVFVVCSSFNIATDFCIIILPIFQLWKLKVNVRQKIQLFIMFSLGGFVLIISIIRIPQLLEISRTDQSWALTGSAIWTSLECAVATLSACLPTMRPLFSRLVGHTPDSSVGTAYVPSKSKKPTLGDRTTKSRRPNEPLADIQLLAIDEEASYRSYIPLEGSAEASTLKQHS